jgi:hypothetical protein
VSGRSPRGRGLSPIPGTEASTPRGLGREGRGASSDCREAPRDLGVKPLPQRILARSAGLPPWPAWMPIYLGPPDGPNCNIKFCDSSINLLGSLAREGAFCRDAQPRPSAKPGLGLGVDPAGIPSPSGPPGAEGRWVFGVTRGAAAAAPRNLKRRVNPPRARPCGQGGPGQTRGRGRAFPALVRRPANSPPGRTAPGDSLKAPPDKSRRPPIPWHSPPAPRRRSRFPREVIRITFQPHPKFAESARRFPVGARPTVAMAGQARAKREREK